MGLEAIAAVAAFVALLAVAVRASGRAAQTMGGLFRAPDLGWPTGVQEDDDLHWSWSTASADRAGVPRAPVVEPEWEELDPSTLRVPALPIVRHARS